MVKSIRFLNIAILLYFLNTSVKAVEKDIPILAETKTAYVSASYILADTLGEMSIYEIEKIPSDSLLNFIGNDRISENLTYWIKFSIINNTMLNHVLLEIRPKFKIAELYFRDQDSGLVMQKAGIDYRYSHWNLKYKNILFQLPSTANKESWFYLKVVSDYNIGFGLILTQYPSLINRIIPENLYYGIFYGIVCIATLFSLIFFFKLREYTYLFYALYVIFFGIFALVDWGIIIEYLTYLPINWDPDLYTLPFALMTIFLLFYSRELLETRVKAPLFDKFILSAIFARTIIFIFGTTFNINILYNPTIDNFLLSTAFFAAIYRLRKGYKPARYFLLGLALLYTGLIVHSLENVGWVPYNVIPWFSMYKTGVLEMFFFSLALADRFRILKLEQNLAHLQTIDFLQENSILKDRMITQLNENEKLKDELNRKLETKVQDRTKELEEANNVILDINRYLEESNRKLAGEVKKISLNRVMQKTVTFEEFREIYPDDESCYLYLDKLKWSAGFICKKCGNDRYCNGNTVHSRRCSKCNYIERITSGTIFSHIKFPITKAFYMLFLVNTGEHQTIDELAGILKMRKQTVWYFRKKLSDAIKDSPKRKNRIDEGWSRWIITPDYVKTISLKKYSGTELN